MSSTPETAKTKSRNPFTFKWSHRAWLHRFLVKIYNGIFAMIPFKMKYGIGRMLRKNKFPYQLIKPGSTLVQIGAPVDTLKAGRSRGLYFSLFNGPTGKTVIIEPASESEKAFNQLAKTHGMSDIVFCRSGAWNEKKQLKIYSDPKHPATNFTEGTVDYDAKRLSEFSVFEVPCDTVDNLLRPIELDNIDVLSITTNGAEVEILEGMKETLEKGVTFICLATHKHLSNIPEMMEKLGYQEYAFDDRGVTYQRKT
ncbi:hypothetical protein CA13_23060 [Planctomycetes bacterium CA13]|uniref:Methyltransferase FkbM domain-containing protein n=1 Tax=Novipirellula herctigrandis TaxID=2527986 RepID=A0A5C5Z112_9BACT|nr:hypothetical protein CA13_23060 [Planctomycetes bacterium CA13]